jgi:hypothetical protein
MPDISHTASSDNFLGYAMRCKGKVLVKGNNVKVLFVGTVFSRSNVAFFFFVCTSKPQNLLAGRSGKAVYIYPWHRMFKN